MTTFTRLPGTLEQLPTSADAYYQGSLTSAIFTFEYTGRKDSSGVRVYEKIWFDGEHGGFTALMPYQVYVSRVKEAAKCSRSMGVPRFYRPVDPETGRFWGEVS